MEFIEHRLKLRCDRSGLCGAQMCSLFLLMTRPRNFEWRNSIGEVLSVGVHHFVEIAQYWCQGLAGTYIGESIGFTSIRCPCRRVMFFVQSSEAG